MPDNLTAEIAATEAKLTPREAVEIGAMNRFIAQQRAAIDELERNTIPEKFRTRFAQPAEAGADVDELSRCRSACAKMADEIERLRSQAKPLDVDAAAEEIWNYRHPTIEQIKYILRKHVDQEAGL
jgi:hypothetical protein